MPVTNQNDKKNGNERMKQRKWWGQGGAVWKGKERKTR